MTTTRNLIAVAASTAALTLTASARAGTFAPITIDGDFSDWATVPVATTASVNTGTPIDFTQLKIANDATNVYFLVSFATAVNPQSGAGTFLAVDSDNSGSTGYNIFGNPAIGSNFGFQNDFPFTEAAGNFNSGGTNVGATYAASPYNTVTSTQEIAIPLSATQADGSAGGFTGTIFPGTFTVEFFSTDGAGDTLGPVTYSLATPTLVPEPASLSLLAAGVAVPLVRRRRRTA